MHVQLNSLHPHSARQWQQSYSHSGRQCDAVLVTLCLCKIVAAILFTLCKIVSRFTTTLCKIVSAVLFSLRQCLQFYSVCDSVRNSIQSATLFVILLTLCKILSVIIFKICKILSANLFTVQDSY